MIADFTRYLRDAAYEPDDLTRNDSDHSSPKANNANAIEEIISSMLYV